VAITTRITNGNVDLTKIARYVQSITVSESGGTALVEVDIKDGGSGGNTIASVRCPIGTSVPYTFPKPGLKCPSGVFLFKAGSGTLNGSIITS
jgi:hypothetical protein